MTPLDVAQGLAEFLKERIADYEERCGKDFNIYAGFMPRARTDDAEQSTVNLVFYATVYDSDLKEGCQSLFQLLEFIRAHLLMANPVAGKYWIQPGLKTSVPDD